jgi:hypothetical protein
MNEHCLSLTFSLDDQAPLHALEAVLAVARRGNVRLARLDVDHCAVAIALQADDPDLLALCHARLHNLIGVFDISMSNNFTIAPAQLLVAC